MPFSPEIFGAQAAAALNALSANEQGTGFVMNLRPRGTLFEADFLLSCSGQHNSPVTRLLRASISGSYHGRILVEGFLGKPPNKKGVRVQVLALLRQLRRTIPRPLGAAARSGPAFTDAKFGPRAAKLLNALLALELAVVSGARTVSEVYYPKAPMFASWAEERPAFALLTEEGTEFTAELLLLQSISLDYFIKDAQERGEDFGILAALFPAYGAVPTEDSNFRTRFTRAVSRCLDEMFSLRVVVTNRAVTVLMAGVDRLGRSSPLARIDQGVLRIIVEMVIADMVKGIVAHAQR